MCSNMCKCIFMICPPLVPFLPSSDMLDYQLRTQFLGFVNIDVSIEAKFARRVIDRY